MCAAVLAGGGLLAATPVAASAAPTQDARDKIEAAVQEDFEERDRVDFWVRLQERPDLSVYEGVDDWTARGQGVYDALTSTAEQSQRGVRAKLDSVGVGYSTFWISNAVRVSGGSEQLALDLAGRAEVEGIYPTVSYQAPDPEPSPDGEIGPAAVEWGIADINADDVWSEFGVTGEGVVVASIDTGVQYDHPALVGSYRGNQGDGTFDHDYSWFDAAGVSPDEPVDTDGHGSHVTGTMAGDDGGDNQIGVAPGVRWIAANGCCPSDQALIESGQWMLAPTRTDGTDPDPAMRPHVINNSWGTLAPSNDPFMEDVSLAWAAAGQFGVWANGNNGPGCESSGSPGSRIVNYSVGNYDAAAEINPLSSRGAGQDGAIKPDVSAPGTEVRSSVPGNGYAYYSGTSMASPHVAGAIALLWSGAPALVGDIDLTRELLDGTAVDTPDDQCGGTDADNNVFGEGRLDALALLEAAPTGETGVVEGTVTDATTGDPLPGAVVTVEGPLERTLSTGADGSYRALVTSGDYTLTASRFGWEQVVASVTVPLDGTVTQDFALEPSPVGTVSGTVTDGSGQGYPLYAKVSVAGTSLLTFTDPADGSYELDVPLDTPAQLRVEVQYPGYQVATSDLDLAGDAVVDVAALVDADSCTAPGYQRTTDGLSETFDDGVTPSGWSVEDGVGNGQVWAFDDPAGRGNMTGGEGGAAIVDSDFYGPEGTQDTSLVSPVVDLGAESAPSVTFSHSFEQWDAEVADVDLSIDGGDTWTTVASYTTPQPGVTRTIPLPTAANQTEVRLRWHYHDAAWALWWQVDDVLIGSRTCDPSGEGGYVYGNVSSGVDGAPVRGAVVTSLDAPDDRGTSTDTPADVNQDDGFYWLFSTLAGVHPFEAAARLYTPATQQVTVPDGGAVRADVTLDGGVLSVDPSSIDTEVLLGGSDSAELTVTNEGTAAAEVVLAEVSGSSTILRADGRAVTSTDAQGAPARTSPVDASVSAAPGLDLQPGQRPAGREPQEEPWTELTPFPFPVVDSRTVTVDGEWVVLGGSDGLEPSAAVHRYDPEGMEWTELAPLPEPVNAPAAGVTGGQLVVSGGWDASGSPTTATAVYDAGADSWSEAADNPAAVSAAGQAVLDGRLYTVAGCTTADCSPASSAVSAYDPGSDSWEELAEYPEASAFVSCGGIEGRLYCTGGVQPDSGEGSSSTYAYDPSSDTWSPVAQAPSDSWGSAYAAADGSLVVSGGIQQGGVSNEAFAYDPVDDSWADLPNPNVAAYRGSGACGFVQVGGVDDYGPLDVVEYLPGFEECADTGADVPWLSLSETELSLAPGESATVQVVTDGDVAQPGTYTAGVRVGGGVPGSDPTVEVTMSVLPPNAWGKLAGVVDGQDCAGSGTPLGGAVVDAHPERADQPSWRMVTDTEGRYARWIDTRVGDLELIASAAGHLSASADVAPVRGQVVEQDFTLLDEDCEQPPGPVHPDVVRVAGEHRYGTAVALSQGYEPGVEVAFVATGATYPDALAAAALAGSTEAPVLLTRPGSLPGVTSAELQRLDPQEVVVLGGEAAVTDEVLDQVEHVAQAPTRRVAGLDRYRTAALVAQEFGSSGTAYVATGHTYPDALAAAAVAGAQDAPVLLVRPGSVPAATASALRDLGTEEIVLLGGEGAVGEAVETALAEFGTVTRVAGADRYGTAALVSRAYDTADPVYVASGQDWPDALAGAARAGAQEVPMLLVRKDGVPGATWSALERLEPGRIVVLGGTMAVQEGVLDQLRTLE
ncbi:cell wall-binding repeat-containing protein [Serinicoccus sp. LYQ131]|uniref:cell wall-binding repeat-containing protein n=1 Tax=Serinicoccus sp. LYQ131 TaxID=3378797 RepID=UPI0038527B99